MNDHEMAKKAAAEETGSPSAARNKISVYEANADSFDRTPGTLQPLDHFIRDGDIVRIVKLLHPCSEQFADWGSRFHLTAEAYFSPPYPSVAQTALGYP